MIPIRTLIVDDEPDALAVLALLLKDFPEVTLVGQAHSAREAELLVESEQPELVILDVEMPEANGFDFLHAFEVPPFKVIFATAFDHYAIRAIKHSALDYLLKPVNREELGMALKKVDAVRGQEDVRIAQLNALLDTPDTPDRIIITSQRGFITLQLKEILSITAQAGNYAYFQMQSGKTFTCTKALSHYEALLDTKVFFRIHRSHMVNLHHVKAFNASKLEVMLTDGSCLPVAVRRKPEFTRRVHAVTQNTSNA
ncbi:MAG: LytR/AlgR family response regulator transcription factor [Salibacteraceae bacterium]